MGRHPRGNAILRTPRPRHEGRRRLVWNLRRNEIRWNSVANQGDRQRFVAAQSRLCRSSQDPPSLSASYCRLLGAAIMLRWTESALKAHQDRIGAGAGRIVRGRYSIVDPVPAAKPKPARTRSAGEEALEYALRAANAPAWVAEYRFDPERLWRADFAFLEARLLVEVEGGTFSKTPGRHTRGKGFEEDCVKYCEALCQGWRVLRVTTAMVDDGRAVGFIMRALNG